MINNNKLTLMMFQEKLHSDSMVELVVDSVGPRASQSCSSARWRSSVQ